MNWKKYHTLICTITGIALAITITGCYKNLIPGEKDFFSDNANLGRENYQVNLGRTNVFIADFNPDYSTQPLTFTIENVRHQDSTAAPELLEQIDTWQWKKYYKGDEKSIAEIEAKRVKEKRPVLDIRPNSGDVIFWNSDSSKIKPGIYTFDVRVKNNAGQKVFRKRILDIRRPRPYEPYEFDDATGLRKTGNDGILHPGVSGLRDDFNNALKNEDVIMYFNKKDDKGNSVTFKFYDKDSLPIPVNRFNSMKWDTLMYRSPTADAWVHFGFNRQMAEDSSTVKYDITNPFPVLADVGTGGERAGINFIYNRIAFGYRQTAGLSFGFAIYEPGNWEVIYKFRINPKFTDD
jgi:hypothetical protein